MKCGRWGLTVFETHTWTTRHDDDDERVEPPMQDPCPTNILSLWALDPRCLAMFFGRFCVCECVCVCFANERKEKKLSFLATDEFLGLLLRPWNISLNEHFCIKVMAILD